MTTSHHPGPGANHLAALADDGKQQHSSTPTAAKSFTSTGVVYKTSHAAGSIPIHGPLKPGLIVPTGRVPRCRHKCWLCFLLRSRYHHLVRSGSHPKTVLASNVKSSPPRHTGHGISCSFHLCARQTWRRRKHGFVRRTINRLAAASHALVGNSVVCNTSGRAMTSGGSQTSSRPVPT